MLKSLVDVPNEMLLHVIDSAELDRDELCSLRLVFRRLFIVIKRHLLATVTLKAVSCQGVRGVAGVDHRRRQATRKRRPSVGSMGYGQLEVRTAHHANP